MWLCGLSLAKLVPEWDVQTVSPHGFPYIFSYIFLCLAFNFFFFLVPVTAPAVTGGCRERWGWLWGGGLLLDPSSGGMNSATLLVRCWNPVAVAGQSQWRQWMSAQRYMLAPMLLQESTECGLGSGFIVFFGVSWHGWLIPCLPSWFLADGLERRATAPGLLCKVLTSKIQIANPKITTCSFIMWNQLVNLQIVPQPLVSHFALLNSEALKHKCSAHPLALNLPGPDEDGVAKDGAFQLKWAQCCPEELVSSPFPLKASWSAWWHPVILTFLLHWGKWDTAIAGKYRSKSNLRTGVGNFFP